MYLQSLRYSRSSELYRYCSNDAEQTVSRNTEKQYAALGLHNINSTSPSFNKRDLVVCQVLFALGFQRLSAVAMICGMRTRSWVKANTPVSTPDSAQGLFLGLKCNRVKGALAKDATPWYLKLLCEGEDEKPGTRDSPQAEPAANSELEADRVHLASSHHRDRNSSEVIVHLQEPPVTPRNNGPDGKPEPQTLEYVISKKLKSSKKILHHHRVYKQPYYPDPSIITKYKHSSAH